MILFAVCVVLHHNSLLIMIIIVCCLGYFKLPNVLELVDFS